uniref:EGF-like domain-containing protein n=1 Tax=Heterorhabditis bacteriophora TaxID=37862 RepID=A0A1I7XQX3_HETBA
MATLCFNTLFFFVYSKTRQNDLTPLIDDVHHVRTFRLSDHEIIETMEEVKVEITDNLLSSSCKNGGFLNETDGSCICIHPYTGPRCQIPDYVNALAVSLVAGAILSALKVKLSMVDADVGKVMPKLTICVINVVNVSTGDNTKSLHYPGF